MTTLHLRVGLPSSDPPRVHPSGQIRRSSGIDSCRLHEAEREFLAVRMWRRDLMLGYSSRFKNSTAMTADLGRLSLEVRAQRLYGFHQQGPANSDLRVATTTRRRYRWFKDLNIIFREKFVFWFPKFPKSIDLSLKIFFGRHLVLQSIGMDTAAQHGQGGE